MQGFNLEELTLRHQQFPIREKVFTMDADPRTHLDFIVSIHFARELLAGLDVKRRLLARMPRMQMWHLMTLAFFRAHRD